MIEVQLWQLGVAAVGVAWLLRRTLTVGRVQAWITALNTIESVAKLYAANDQRALNPAESDIAQVLGEVMPDLINGYARAQAEEAATAIRR